MKTIPTMAALALLTAAGTAWSEPQTVQTGAQSPPPAQTQPTDSASGMAPQNERPGNQGSQNQGANRQGMAQHSNRAMTGDLASGRQRFTTLDRNRDGWLSNAELQANAQGMVFVDIDTDRNAQISSMEWDRSIDGSRFSSLDTDRNGMLSTAEVQADTRGDLRFDDIDGDRNSSISSDEWRRRSLQQSASTNDD